MLPLFLTFVLSSQYEEISPKLLFTSFQNLSPLLLAAQFSSTPQSASLRKNPFRILGNLADGRGGGGDKLGLY